MKFRTPVGIEHIEWAIFHVGSEITLEGGVAYNVCRKTVQTDASVAVPVFHIIQGVTGFQIAMTVEVQQSTSRKLEILRWFIMYQQRYLIA